MNNDDFKLKIIECLGRIEEKLTNTVTKEQCGEHRNKISNCIRKFYWVAIGAVGIVGAIAKFKGLI